MMQDIAAGNTLNNPALMPTGRFKRDAKKTFAIPLER